MSLSFDLIKTSIPTPESVPATETIVKLSDIHFPQPKEPETTNAPATVKPFIPIQKIVFKNFRIYLHRKHI